MLIASFSDVDSFYAGPQSSVLSRNIDRRPYLIRVPQTLRFEFLHLEALNPNQRQFAPQSCSELVLVSRVPPLTGRTRLIT